MKYKLEELIELKTQGVNTTTDKIKYVSEGYKIVQAKNIEAYSITFDEKNFVSEETYSRMKENHKLHKGEVLYTNIGSQLGNCAIYNSNEKAIITWNVMKLIPKPQLISNYFLCYLLNYYKPEIASLNSSSTMPFVSGKVLMNFEFNIPDISIQNKITKILNMIDNKIKLNSKTNDNLSKLCMEIFNELYNTIDDEYVLVEDMVNFSQGKQIAIEHQYLEKKDGMQRFLRIVDFTNNNEPKRYVKDFGERYFVKSDDIIMIRYGSQTCGDVVRGKEGIIANNMFKVIPNNNELKNYIYYFLNSSKIQDYIKNAQNSSTMPSINFGLLNKLEIKKVKNDIVDKFNRVIEPIRIKRIQLEEQNELLEQLRDTLLPELMNGKLDLDNIEGELLW
jgi:type I restriction enzyme S subunit